MARLVVADLTDLDLRRLLLHGAEWRVERISTEHDGERWAIVVVDDQRRKAGAYADPRFTSYDAAREWLLAFFARAT